MNEEELKAKAEELERKEGDLAKREQELNAREEQFAKREADTSSITQTLKEEFQKKLEAQKQEFEERLQQRDEVIKQLASGEESHVNDDDPFEKLNKRRIAQKAA